MVIIHLRLTICFMDKILLSSDPWVCADNFMKGWPSPVDCNSAFKLPNNEGECQCQISVVMLIKHGVYNEHARQV